MDHLGYDFVIMVKGMKVFVHEKIREVQGSFEEKRQYTIRRYQVNGTTVKAKAKYEAEKEVLTDLIKLRNEMRKDELMEAVLKSEHSYTEIMAFIKGETEE